MMIRAASLVLGVSILLSGPNMAFAESCPEGRTMMGECLNPGLAATMRQNAIVYSQSQLSQTAQPIMPQEDYTYRYPHALTTLPPQGQGGVTPPPPTFTFPDPPHD